MDLGHPTNQKAEVLYLHLINEWISDNDIHHATHIMKPCARRSELRELGVEFERIEIPTINKFNRSTKFSRFRITNKAKARKIYDSLVA